MTYERIVVKLGTSVLTGGATRLDRAHMVDLARQCAALLRAGVQVVICSSGAIAAGRAHLPEAAPPFSLTAKQMLAAVGQSRLMETWARLFDLYGVRIGQVLLTRADVEDRRRYLNARDTLGALLAHGIVPVVNENDAVATAEIKVGDNDNLSALVALMVEADALLLLTDQPGLFTADPRDDPSARLIPEVDAITDDLRVGAGGAAGTLGTGGMATKLQAADAARRGGVDVVIAAGRTPDVILAVARGERTGTRFPALDTVLDHRRRWILTGPAPAGHLVIDDGAADALLRRGGSLLPAGVCGAEGAFRRGDAVLIRRTSRDVVGRGIVRYDHGDLRRIMGAQTDAVAGLLGYDYGPTVIHRNDLLLEP